MSNITNTDYETIELFIEKVLQRCTSGQSTVANGVFDLMHPLDAWNEAGQLTSLTETIPWMEIMLKEWSKDNTDQFQDKAKTFYHCYGTQVRFPMRVDEQMLVCITANHQSPSWSAMSDASAPETKK